VVLVGACLVRFGSMSETDLLEPGLVWLLPLVFGVYGLAAEKAIALVECGEAKTLAVATPVLVRATRSRGLVPLLLPAALPAGLPARLPARREIACRGDGGARIWTGIDLLVTECLWSML
jgi:hypothetical protein